MKLRIYPAVVIVYLLPLLIGDEGEVYQAPLVRNERQHLEGIEFPELRLHILPNGKQVLDPDTVPALLVQPRFVGHDHAWHQRHIDQGRRDPQRPLVHIEAAPNAMARAMEEALAELPEELLCKDIELDASRPLQELLPGKGKVPLEHQRVVALLLISGHISEKERPRDIRGAELELRSRIEDKKPVAIDRHMAPCSL